LNVLYLLILDRIFFYYFYIGHIYRKPARICLRKHLISHAFLKRKIFWTKYFACIFKHLPALHNQHGTGFVT